MKRVLFIIALMASINILGIDNDGAFQNDGTEDLASLKELTMELQDNTRATPIYKFNYIVPRANPKPMTTSVIVPCVARHFFWLSGMLEAYQNQTVRPDEIVVSLSEVEKLSPKEIDQLEKGLWDFKLKIIRNNGVVIDGDNRTIAMDASSGEILLFSDADDLPHPQRVEIAKYFFENYEIDHILHAYTHERTSIAPIDIETINVMRMARFDDIWHFPYPLTCGSPCFLRKVADRLKWHAIRDVEYNRDAYALFPNRFVLPLNLILYRSHLSSHA